MQFCGPNWGQNDVFYSNVVDRPLNFAYSFSFMAKLRSSARFEILKPFKNSNVENDALLHLLFNIAIYKSVLKSFIFNINTQQVNLS